MYQILLDGALYKNHHFSTPWEQKSLFEVLWLTCFIYVYVLYIISFFYCCCQNLKIKYLKLSVCLKKCFGEADILLLYIRLLAFLGKKSTSITRGAEFLYLILHSHICIWSSINEIAIFPLQVGLWLPAIMCLVKQKTTQPDVSVNRLRMYF